MHRSSPSIGTLIDLLEAQQVRFETLLTVLDREGAAIKALAPASLVEHSESKLTLLEDIRLLEEKRSAVVLRLAGNWGVPAETLTLRAIAERVGPIEAGLLLRLHERLHRVASALRRATGTNGELIARGDLSDMGGAGSVEGLQTAAFGTMMRCLGSEGP
jgi:hypothetical protein